MGRHWTRGGSPGNEKPCLRCGEQGSHKSVIQDQIVNYPLASSGRSLLGFSIAKIAKPRHAWIARAPDRKPGFPTGRDIPAQRTHAVACECIGYVVDEIIRDKGNRVLLLRRKGVKCILIFSSKARVGL
jgi:hypothetical protein